MQTSTKKIRKKAGIFYTPEFLTSFITKIAISDYILDLHNNQFNSLDEILNSGSAVDLKKFENLLRNLKILDPACGEGAFLIQSAEFLLKLR